jgi:phosphoserine phosphatase RsbU/P
MLGVADSITVQRRTVRMLVGDVLVLHTDGITDGRVSGERFGEERVRTALAAAGPSAQEPVHAIGAAVEAWRPGPDDEAILAVRVTGA